MAKISDRHLQVNIEATKKDIEKDNVFSYFKPINALTILTELQTLREAIQVLEMYDPPMPPRLERETPAQYTDRITGADGTNRRPYQERRFRQCSIGYHDECSDPEGEECECPCHQFEERRLEVLKKWEEA